MTDELLKLLEQANAVRDNVPDMRQPVIPPKRDVEAEFKQYVRTSLRNLNRPFWKD